MTSVRSLRKPNGRCDLMPQSSSICLMTSTGDVDDAVVVG